MDKELSDKETALYAKFVAIDQTKRTQKCLLVLGFSGVRKDVTMWVYLMANKKDWAIPIVSSIPYKQSLLATLVVGLRHLSANPLHYDPLCHLKPFKDIEVTPLKANVTNKTFLKTEESDKTVFKFFDSKDEEQYEGILLSMQHCFSSGEDIQCASTRI